MFPAWGLSSRDFSTSSSSSYATRFRVAVYTIHLSRSVANGWTKAFLSSYNSVEKRVAVSLSLSSCFVAAFARGACSGDLHARDCCQQPTLWLICDTSVRRSDKRAVAAAYTWPYWRSRVLSSKNVFIEVILLLSTNRPHRGVKKKK